MSGGSYQKAGSGDAGIRLAGDSTKDRMYEPKRNQKAVRVLTVIAYVFSVSLAAIMLSLYYVFLWKPAPSSKLAAGSNLSLTTECSQGQYHTVAQRSAETPRVLPIQENILAGTTTELPLNFSNPSNSSDFFDY